MKWSVFITNNQFYITNISLIWRVILSLYGEGNVLVQITRQILCFSFTFAFVIIVTTNWKSSAKTLLFFLMNFVSVSLVYSL